MARHASDLTSGSGARSATSPPLSRILAGFTILVLTTVAWASGPSFLYRTQGTPTQITIDGSVQYQTIEGLGSFEGWLLPQSDLYPAIFDDLGVSILRFRMFAYVEQVPDQKNEARDNDNADPFSILWSNVKTNFFDAGHMADLLAAAKARGAKLVGTVFEPPLWMTDASAEEQQQTHLTPGYEDEMIEFIMIWLQGMHNLKGLDIDYISIQNEPDAGCCFMRYSPQEVVAFIRKLGPRIAAAGLPTKIIAPDTSRLASLDSYVSAIAADSTALRYVAALATHPYDYSFNQPDTLITPWQNAAAKAAAYSKPLWMTEWLSATGDWTEAFNTAQNIHNALVYGQVTAWMWYETWKGPGPAHNPYSIWDYYGVITPKYYTLKQYFHWVRPGAVRIKADATDPGLLVSAFVQKKDRTFTAVVINRAASSRDAQINVAGVPGLTSLSMSRTSARENAVGAGVAARKGTSFSATLPAQSVTTFSGSIAGTAQLPKISLFPHLVLEFPGRALPLEKFRRFWTIP
jgi:O-glycosyl hydrolase